ncbi:putative quinol monooxygenase [Ferrimonas balearica]|uniref:putative quinol monooxygenase n=1 Tax=Ferrimonas balearica TaxID=44012 RepID=UPI001F2EC8B1|nr:antibiotic biosynthesis monooxygenase [Ferrimonas balearica]MBY6095275.1 antibiotic biosynthesis monooxygenase [Ferrimonas balearica]
MSTPISLTASLRLTPDAELPDGIAAISAFCAAMRSEPGCTFAHAMQENENPRQFILWEQYRDRDAQQAHFQAPHTQSFIASGLTELVSVSEGVLISTDYLDSQS